MLDNFIVQYWQCWGQRFESAMLHSGLAEMQVFFRCIMQNSQVPACKTCKMGYPFRDVPQFIPQLVPENPGKSKESVHLRQLFLLGFHAGMGIQLECQGNFRVSQDFGKSTHIHAGFDGSGCERVPQRMDAHLR